MVIWLCVSRGAVILSARMGGWPYIKRYWDELKGAVGADIWDDIDKINPAGNERLGYPTQKPVTLLERMIWASSNEGDVGLDPFCGCGTAVDAAQKLKRKNGSGSISRIWQSR